MKKTTLLTAFFLTLKISGYADVIPEPVVVKGIVAQHPVNVQMVSEVVNVHLTLDSAFVQCTFNMHNFGGKLDMNVGFPIMNFYLEDEDYLSPVNKDKFEVLVKGKKVDKIDFHIPEELKNMLAGVDEDHRYEVLDKYKNQNKPWYLWKTHFDKNEQLTIVVRYRLPNGANHQGRFFDYLLSTGAGWKGNIREAKVFVTLDNIPETQLISIAPGNYKKNSAPSIAWDFKNIKPTVKDDILIYYEQKAGDYKAHKARMDSIVAYVDGKRGHFTSVAPEDVGYFKIGHGDTIIIFSKEYVWKTFKNKAKKVHPDFWRQISNKKASDIENHFALYINGKAIDNDHLFDRIFESNTLTIIKAEIKGKVGGKSKMNLICK